ncbi:MAG: AAA family ATPase [Bacillota bacterium]
MPDRWPRELRPDEMGNRCSPDIFTDDNEAVASEGDGIIGQERAVRSVRFGLEVSSPGYNIFMSGAPGTGKSTFARAAVRDKATELETPRDWCYLYNFSEPNAPWALSLPAGRGIAFKADMDELIEDARTAIINEFEGGDYEKRRTEIIEQFQRRTTENLQEIEDRVREQGFALQKGTGGFASIPLNEEGKPMSNDEFQSLDTEKRREIEEKGTEIQREIREAVRSVRQLEKEVKSAIKDLEKTMGSFAIRPLVEQMQEKYSDFPAVCSHLEDVHDDIIEHLDQFKGEDGEGDMMSMFPRKLTSSFARYQVNLLVNNAETSGAPVVEETNPTYYNLVGKIEYESSMGTMVTDHTLIQAGALHRANGGFLILRAEDVLVNALSWDALKRSLKNKAVRVENIDKQYRLVPTTAIRPEPIPLDVKILLVGSPLLYYLLSTYDDDFRKHFKIKADFDIRMDRTEEYLQQYGSFVRMVCERDGLLPFEPAAIAGVVDYSCRLTEDQTKLSARFNDIVAIVYESDAWARSEDSDRVSAEHVNRAVKEKIYRSRLVEDHIREAIDRGKIMVDTEGRTVGQINGLSVIDLGDYSFGHPSRITANVYLGDEGVVNLERQVKMSGSGHSKGVFILASYLANLFAYDKPLSLSASITFEQMYGEIDGDSASSAELYAILSSLADVPLPQSIAVTGSVNQKGQVQPIGGVNEKVEGFYYTCKAAGLTGEQGVLIPEKNADNLMLNDEVIAAVDEGSFHVWAVRDVREAIELLTGMPAGERIDDEEYPPDTVFGRADRRLRQMAQALRKFSDSSSDDEGTKDEENPENPQ